MVGRDPATVIQRIVRGTLARLRVLIGEFKAPGSVAYGLIGHTGRSGARRPPGPENWTANLRRQDPRTLRTFRLIMARMHYGYAGAIRVQARQPQLQPQTFLLGGQTVQWGGSGLVTQGDGETRNWHMPTEDDWNMFD